MTKLRFWLIFICLGLGASLVYRYLQAPPEAATPQGKAQESTSLSGSDAFALHLFQSELNGTQGNVITAPASLAALLHQLQELGNDDLRQALAQHRLPDQLPQTSTAPIGQELLCADNQLDTPGTPAYQQLMRLPFHDLPLSFGLINGMLEQTTGCTLQLELGQSSPIQPGIRLLAISLCQFEPEFQYPFENDANTADEFDNDNGGMPTIQMMNNRGLYRRASAPDGSWEAIALPCKPQFRHGDPLYFIAILPAGRARTMGREMTEEKLTDIRQALAETEPRIWGVSLPEMRSHAGTRSLAPLLQRAGLGLLFDQPGVFPLRNNKSMALDTALQHLDFRMQAERRARSKPAAPPLQSDTLVFNRPFIWLVGDLSSAAPPFLMGLVENF